MSLGIGGKACHLSSKTGKDHFYKKYIAVADKLYDIHIEELKKEGLIK